MNGRLNGIRVLVTGSSKGIGRGIALRLAQEGADVVINYNSDPGGADEAVAEIRALGRTSVALKGNVGSVDGVRTLVAESAKALGGLDVLVNNAGIERHAAVLGRHRSRLRRGPEREPEGRVLRHAGVRPALPRRRPAGHASSTSARCTRTSRSRTSPPTAPPRAACGC